MDQFSWQTRAPCHLVKCATLSGLGGSQRDFVGLRVLAVCEYIKELPRSSCMNLTFDRSFERIILHRQARTDTHKVSRKSIFIAPNTAPLTLQAFVGCVRHKDSSHLAQFPYSICRTSEAFSPSWPVRFWPCVIGPVPGRHFVNFKELELTKEVY